MDMTSEDIAIDVQPPDVDIIYYIAGFIARSLTKHFKLRVSELWPDEILQIWARNGEMSKK